MILKDKIKKNWYKKKDQCLSGLIFYIHDRVMRPESTHWKNYEC
jgi:hypothetical protein